MSKKTFAVAVTCSLLLAPLVASTDPVPKAPVLCLQGSPCLQPAPAVPAPSPPPPSATKPPAGSGAIKFQPGWYGIFNKTCIPVTGNYGCSAAEIVSTIGSEICPNPNLVGLKILGLPSFFMSDTPGVYTAPDRGFQIIDQALDALRACNKYLMLQAIPTILVDQPNQSAQFYPKYTYDSSWSSDGAASGGTYGIVHNTQSSQGGMTARIWRDDWRDLAIAAVTAYCARYESNPAFYAIGMIYWNTSLPLNPPLPSGYSEATFNNQYRTYETAARAACPTTNILATLDWVSDNPGEMSRHLAALQAIKGSVANNDVWITYSGGMTHGQSAYTGAAGSPSVIDYRGVVRYMEEIETPDMCDSGRQTATPAQLFDVIQNGNSVNRARWPSHIVVSMATECPAGYDWTAWKTFIASKSGKVMNGRDSTLRTPGEVKTSWCESGMTCP